jgi:hypothetical protein
MPVGELSKCRRTAMQVQDAYSRFLDIWFASVLFLRRITCGHVLFPFTSHILRHSGVSWYGLFGVRKFGHGRLREDRAVFLGHDIVEILRIAEVCAISNISVISKAPHST